MGNNTLLLIRLLIANRLYDLGLVGVALRVAPSVEQMRAIHARRKEQAR